MADLIPVLREPSHQVSRRAPAVWAIGALVTALLLAVIALIASAAVDDITLTWWAWALYGGAAATYIAVMPAYRYRVHRWESTATAVYTQSGWLSRERRIAPMSRVQTVDFDQSLLDRVFGLAGVTVTTASAAGPVRIEGLDREVAERLVEDLTRRTEAEAGDAT